VQIVDRLKDVIKSGGEWIVSLELENLLSLHEGVLEAAVIGIPHERGGERPLAIIVPMDEWKGRLTPEMLREHLEGYVQKGVITSWAIPDEFAIIDELPRTSVGKIDKKVLRSRRATV
jgi:fatty-acyl-CoA synthase